MISLNVDGSTKCIIGTLGDVLDLIERYLGDDSIQHTCPHGDVWGLGAQEPKLLVA